MTFPYAPHNWFPKLEAICRLKSGDEVHLGSSCEYRSYQEYKKYIYSLGILPKDSALIIKKGK